MASWFLSTCFIAAVGGADCTILQFTAAWCEPCRELQPALARLRQEGWQIRSVDADRERQMVSQFQVQNLPTLVFVSGGREVDRMVGVATYEQILKRAQRVAARSQGGAAGRRAPSDRAAGVGTPSPAAPAGQTMQPIVRGQSPVRAAPGVLSAAVQAMGSGTVPSLPSSGTGKPPLTPEQAIARAAAATVRIRVDEANTTAYGTGTIVDVHGREALVLTCGHLFRDMQPNSQLTIDLFAGTPQEVNLAAQLIDFTAEEADIGLISFQLPVAIEPVELLPQGAPLQIGQPAFSFGCDHGQDPTRRDTRIANINRYIGAANIEIVGAPAVGRSGGGLFDVQGRLIGVCNAADANDDEGIYAAADVIYAQIDRLGLSHLFASPAATTLVAEPAPTTGGTTQLAGSELTVPAGSTGFGQSAAAGVVSQVEPRSPSPASSTGQLICIVRGAEGQDQVLTIDSPTPELLQAIQRSAQHR